MRKKSIHKDKKNRKKTYRNKTNRKEKYRKSNLKKTKHKKTYLKNKYSRKNKQSGGMEFTDPDADVAEHAEASEADPAATGQPGEMLLDVQGLLDELYEKEQELIESVEFGRQLLQRAEDAERYNEELKTLNSQLEMRVHEEIEQAQTLIDEYNADNEERQQELQVKEDELNLRESEIEDELKQTRARIDEFEQEKKKLNNECEEAKTKLSTIISGLETKIKTLEGDLRIREGWQGEVEISQAALRKKHGELQNAVKALEAASSQNQKLTAENTELSAGSEALSKCLEDIKAKLVEFNVSIENL